MMRKASEPMMDEETVRGRGGGQRKAPDSWEQELEQETIPGCWYCREWLPRDRRLCVWPKGPREL